MSAPFRLLRPRRARTLRRAAPTVPADLSLDGPVPAGYRRFVSGVLLTRGDLEGAAQELLTWQVHRRAGLGVRADGTPMVRGTAVELRLALGPFAVSAPCRVIDLSDEPGRRGFTYVTLPGHPERGIERFLLRREENGDVLFTVEVVSTQARWSTRLARSLAEAVQNLMTRRYLSALGPGQLVR